MRRYPSPCMGIVLQYVQSTGATPYSLVYGMEAVLPVEVEIPSLRVLLDIKLDEAEWIRTRFNELSLIEEKRMEAICHGQLYRVG